MSEFRISLKDKGRCQIRHVLADAEIITDLPPEYGGNGRSFSSTDLVSAALGSCILTSIDSIVEEEGYDPDKLEISVRKGLSENPKMISSISLDIFYPEELEPVLVQKIEQAIASCPVKRSLNECIDISYNFKFL